MQTVLEQPSEQLHSTRLLFSAHKLVQCKHGNEDVDMDGTINPEDSPVLTLKQRILKATESYHARLQQQERHAQTRRDEEAVRLRQRSEQLEQMARKTEPAGPRQRRNHGGEGEERGGHRPVGRVAPGRTAAQAGSGQPKEPAKESIEAAAAAAAGATAASQHPPLALPSPAAATTAAAPPARPPPAAAPAAAEPPGEPVPMDTDGQGETAGRLVECEVSGVPGTQHVDLSLLTDGPALFKQLELAFGPHFTQGEMRVMYMDGDDGMMLINEHVPWQHFLRRVKFIKAMPRRKPTTRP